jgi:glycosyltransferase involved in cell wall biosynthesis
MATIGFVSTRFAGSDGVSLESGKWATVFEDEGHQVCWFAGELDKSEDRSMLVPEAHFTYPDSEAISDGVWGRLYRDREINDAIKRQASFLKEQLYAFVERFGVEILVAENALTIPMQIPLGIALTDFIAESNTPTIAHHHDFYWERTRFAISAIRDYLEMAFPPVLPQIQHAVINSVARDQLAWRKGISSVVVPNVIDFDGPVPEVDPVAVRKAIGLTEDDILILQPTRVVPRKGIEHAINLVSRLKDPRCKLIISHESGDEGDAYLLALQDAAQDANVDLRLVTTVVPDVVDGSVQPLDAGSLGLWDLYGAADLVTYPSLYEGFGNALLEAFFYRVPVLINRYSIFIQDIEPKGFRTITMDGFITPAVVAAVRRILDDRNARKEMGDHNFQVASRYFSYSILRRRLQTLVINVMGMD